LKLLGNATMLGSKNLLVKDKNTFGGPSNNPKPFKKFR
jgi:hypothetical protein